MYYMEYNSDFRHYWQILDICLCVFAALVAQDHRDLIDLSRKPDVINTLISLLHDVHQYDVNLAYDDNKLAERLGFEKTDKTLVCQK